MAARPYIESYVQFPTGRLTLEEIQQIFSTIPFEIDLIDRTDHFSWFSNKPHREHERSIQSLGEHVQKCYPAKAWPIVAKIIASFKDGSRDFVSRPLVMHGHRVLIQYYALRDVDGTYLGTIEFTGSVEAILQAYDNGGWADAATSASKADGKTGQTPAVEPSDADTGASQTETTDKTLPGTVTAEPDATSGASDHPATGSAQDSGTDAIDAYAGASESPATSPLNDSGQADGVTGASEY
ncbi:PAS domain-containing protein [Lacticaseibacillus daqingensis]|uniref:PAS domain-containing protein n=1 Tax=Lacticaseibacillus daqingensis TaxID=2486014 RepID=UPI000F767CB0|nr:PAS domain-containing protein [Lacticaseibacillus daqingensis]